MTLDEIKIFEREWLHESELEVSNALDRDCRLGYQWDPEIYKTYRDILADLLTQADLDRSDYDILIARIKIRHPQDDHDGHRELSKDL